MKLWTIHALGRRLDQQRGNVLGKQDVELSLAFKQLQHGRSSLVQLYKAMKAWNDAQSSGHMDDAIKFSSTLESYLEKFGQRLSHDSEMIKRYSLLQKDICDGRSLSTAVHHIRLDELEALHREPVENTNSEPQATTEVTQEDCVEDITGLTCQTKKKRKVDVDMPWLRSLLLEEPLQQVYILIAAQVRAMLYEHPANTAEHQDKAEVAIADLGGVRDAVADIPRLRDGELTKALHAVVVPCKCLRKDETQMPDVEEAGEVRKYTMSLAKTTGPVSELGKAMASRDCA
eukprot:2026716-Pyramimonas_sp.AAC.1